MAKKVVLLCVLLICVGCNPTRPEQTVKNYYPLAVGNHWVYRRAGELPVELTATVSALNEHGVMVYGILVDGEVAWVSNEGCQVIWRDMPNDETGDVWLCEPFDVGANWVRNPSVVGADTCRIDATNAKVSVPAGEFTDCIEVALVEDVSGEVETTSYYAPEVGLVKLTMPGAPALELIEYELK